MLVFESPKMAFIWAKKILRHNLKDQNIPVISIENERIDDPKYDENDMLTKIEVRAIWIQHGALSGLGSTITYPLIGQAIKHCWSEIETNNGLYCVQFHGGANTIQIHKKHSIDDAVKEAKIVGGMKAEDAKVISCIFPKKLVKEGKTIRHLKEFVESYAQNGRYDLVLNNCQDLSSALYKWCG